jgi:hypothetical protein
MGIEEGEFKAIPEKAFHEFRKLAAHITNRVKGSTEDSNIAPAATTLVMQSIMKFRSWIPGLAKERFQGLVYENATKEFEIGRYRVLTNTVFDLWKSKQDNFFADLLSYSTSLGYAAFSEKGRQKVTAEILDNVYENYKRKNPDNKLFRQVESGEISEAEAKKMVLSVWQGQLRAGALEIKAIMSAAIVLFLLGFDYDDDGEGDYKKMFLTRWTKEYTDRLFNELTFFASPTSANEILRTPIPLMALMSDFLTFGVNTFDENKDLLFGENEKADGTGYFYYSKKMIPLLRYPVEWINDIEKDYDTSKKRKTPKRGSREIDIN